MDVSHSSHPSTLSPANTGARKRRLACDNCHLSKVRCTGEVSGCQRCQRGNRFCHYSESNMGRSLDGAQKRRKSTARSTNSTSSHGDLDEFDWTSSSSMSITANQSDPFWNAMANPAIDRLTADSLTAWDESRGLQRHDPPFMDPASEPAGQDFASDIRDLYNMDFDDFHATLLDDETPLETGVSSLIPSPSLPSSARQSLPTRTPVETPDSMQSEPDISSWGALLEKISCTPKASPVALDELLHHSSTLAPRVTRELDSLASDPSCMASLALMLLCLTQIIALFEQCIPCLIRGLASGGSKDVGDISLRLGAFQVDRDAQHALQKHIVGKELSRLLHASKLISQTLQQPGLDRVPKRTHNLLLDDLQVRIKSLVYLVRDKWTTAPQLAF